MSLGVTGAAIPPILGSSYLVKRSEFRAIMEHLGADGSAVNLNAILEHGGLPVAWWRVMVASGDSLPVSFRANERTWWDFATAAAGASKRLIFRPLLNGMHSWGWGLTFPALAGSGVSIPGMRPPAVEVSAWLRKKAAGDATHAKRGIAFGNNIVMGPSAGVPMCGLFGDGAQGFRFGSINCPDGLGAGEIASNTIDAGSVQPAGLANPGAAPFHVRVKMIPPGPSTGEPGKIATYLNGLHVKTFDTLTNLPRGAGGVSAAREFSGVEPGLYAYGDAAAITGFMLWDVRVAVLEDWTV